jgi:Zn-dependent peptidase ImmA (M78 family)
MLHLFAIAAHYGIQIHGSVLPGDLLAMYVPALARIYFDLRLTAAERRSAVAHEIGHAHYGHDCTTAANERQADAFAARLLIPADRYATLERVSPDMHYLADELNVTTRVVEAFRKHCVVRLGDTTYVRPKMGAGQWAARIEMA